MKRWLKHWESIQTASNCRNKLSIKNEVVRKVRQPRFLCCPRLYRSAPGTEASPELDQHLELPPPMSEASSEESPKVTGELR